MKRTLAAAGIVAALLASPLAGTARADEIDPADGSPVSLRTTSYGVLLIYYRHPDGGVRVQERSGGWHAVQGTQFLGGAVSTAPTGMVYLTGDNTQFWVVATGTNGAVYVRHTQNQPPSDWTPWTSLGGGTTDPPAIGCSSENGPPLVYVRGADGALWQGISSGVHWGKIGGSLLSGPATVPSNDGDCYGGPLEVVALGADSAMWRWRPGYGWSKIGGKSTMTPSLVKYGDAEYAFLTGTNGALYYAYRSANFRWSAFTKIGGTFTTAPSAAVWAGGLTVAALGTNGKLYRATRPSVTSGSWTIEAA